jgi:hypothetical protein
MLDVAYEAVDNLPPGRLAKIDEDRGRIRVRLDKTAPLADVVAQLNVEIESLMRSARWFQLWRDEIVSENTPDRPLRIHYILKDWPLDEPAVTERRGILRVYINSALSVEQFAASMNPATDRHLAGGHWFQLYAGEIIDNSPEPNKV